MLNFLIFFPSFALGAPLLAVLAALCLIRPELKWERLFASAAVVIALNPIGQAIASQLTWVRPMKYDLYACRIDALLGNPAFVLGRLVEPHVWLNAVMQIAYGALAP